MLQKSRSEAFSETKHCQTEWRGSYPSPAVSHPRITLGIQLFTDDSVSPVLASASSLPFAPGHWKDSGRGDPPARLWSSSTRTIVRSTRSAGPPYPHLMGQQLQEKRFGLPTLVHNGRVRSHRS